MCSSRKRTRRFAICDCLELIIEGQRQGTRRCQDLGGRISVLPFCSMAGRFHALMDSKASPSTGMINFLTWIEVNKKRLLIGGVAGVVVIFLLILFIRHEA